MKKLFYTFIAVAALAVLGPEVALASSDSGQVLKVMSCVESDKVSRSILVKVVNGNGTEKWFYLGTESSSAPSYTSIALAAMLSGKKVSINYGGQTTRCGTTAYNLQSGSDRSFTIVN